MPRIVFRCDASSAIGSGHVARCMALAKTLRARGAEVELISRALPTVVRDLLVAPAGVTARELAAADRPADVSEDDGEPLRHSHWLEVSQKTDAEQTVHALSGRPRPDWVIVDHYALDARWERRVRKHVSAILAIDDLADRDHACDALLDQNFFRHPQARYEGRVPPDAERMLGPRFALLREEFTAARANTTVRDGPLRRIFLCFGGFDGARQTVRALEAIERAELTATQVDVVIGPAHADRNEIEERCQRQPGWRVHLNAANVAELMAAADVAIGASGIMNWERACLGLPAIIASVAENQQEVAEDLAAERACIYLGHAQSWGVSTLAGLLRGLAGTPSLLRALSERTRALTDGKGTLRVAARLLPSAIELRPATLADCDAIHAWRNDETTRRFSGDAAAIPLTRHREWFQRTLAAPSVDLLIGERANEPVGVLRYDREGAAATVSVYLVPGQSGQGFGVELLRSGSRWLRERRPDVRTIRAHISTANSASLRAFSDAGYLLDHETYTLTLRHE